jgi:hypothetical protein
MILQDHGNLAERSIPSHRLSDAEAAEAKSYRILLVRGNKPANSDVI